ncbi:MAG TPA: multidrug effflux MFS transporter [Caldilineaceae bacterium]|nr:multidrug effflux MFS transporter [Caldilineaceae bacterium]
MASTSIPSSQASNQAVEAYPAVSDEPAPAGRAMVRPIRPLHLLILGGLSALGPLSTDMYLPALPALAEDLSATMAQTQVTLSAGILGLALGQLVAGPSSDAFGRRRPLLIGLAAYLVVSLLCSFSSSIGALTVLRFAQGFTGAAGIVIALAMVNDLYAGVAQARFFALLMQVSGLAPIIAPVIGSQLLVYTSWRGVFVTLAFVGMLLWIGTAFGLGETLPVDRRQRGGLSALVRALAGLVTDRRYLGYALSSGLAFGAGIVYISVSPFILQNLYGVSPQTIGLVFALNALGLVLMSQVSARLVGPVSSQRLLTWGLAAGATGGVLLLAVALSGIGLVGILPALFVIVASLGLTAPNATALALSNTRTAGSASALLGVLQFSIGALVAPLVGLGGMTSALPMAVAIAAFGLLSLFTFLFFCRPAPTHR